MGVIVMLCSPGPRTAPTRDWRLEKKCEIGAFWFVALRYKECATRVWCVVLQCSPMFLYTHI